MDFGRMNRNTRLPKAPTRQHGEDIIYQQIAAFERLLQHTMSRFSKENLYQVLRHVCSWAEDGDRQQRPQTRTPAFKLRSIAQFRDLVERMKESHKTHKTNTSEVDHILKHYELFLNDLLYLKDLKKYFDDEIHKSLQKYVWVSVDTKRSLPEPHRLAKSVSKEALKIDDVDSGHGSPSDADDSRRYTDRNETKRKYSMAENSPRNGSEIRYRQTVNELNLILRKWDGLLSDDMLDLNDFDPDSYHELMQFSSYSQFEAILRLVPDIFAKCYKCIDLAKTWLQESNTVIHDNAEENKTPSVVPKETSTENKKDKIRDKIHVKKDYARQIKNIKLQIESLETSIEEDEAELEKYRRDMAVLAKRTDRLTHVTSDYNKMDSMITIAAGDYQKSKTEQYAVASKLRNCPRGTPTYATLKCDLKRLDSEVAQNHWRVKLLEYERDTVQEDYLVEMEVRPSFIRFTGDTKDKIQDLEKCLQVRKAEKLKLEKQLRLLKTNEEQTRSTMMAKLENTLTDAGNSRVNIPQEAKVSNLLEKKRSGSLLEDGNEADVDSPRPSNRNINGASSVLSTDSAILQKPKLIHKHKHKQRSERPLSESPSQSSPAGFRDKGGNNFGRGPRAALKTTPKRVWENM